MKPLVRTNTEEKPPQESPQNGDRNPNEIIRNRLRSSKNTIDEKYVSDDNNTYENYSEEAPPVIVKPKGLPLESEGGKPHPSNLSGMVICLRNCNSTSKNIKDIIRCSICMSLFHKSCQGEEAKYPGGWNCEDCRLILHNLVTLLKHSQEMKVSIDEINGKLMSVIDKLDQTNDELLTQRQINSDLLKEVDSQSTIIQTLREALNISQRVTISSILPRTDKGLPNLKGENLNLLLKHYADQNMNIDFVDNNKTFLLANTSPNDAYLYDGHHLSYTGTERLIKNLNLPAIVQKRQHRNKSNNVSSTSYKGHQYDSSFRHTTQRPNCIFCGRAGHEANSCRKRTIRRYGCNRFGHSLNECQYT